MNERELGWLGVSRYSGYIVTWEQGSRRLWVTIHWRYRDHEEGYARAGEKIVSQYRLVYCDRSSS